MVGMTDADHGTRAELDKQPEDVASMFDEVSSRYDLMNRLMSGGMDKVWQTAMCSAVGARPEIGRAHV